MKRSMDYLRMTQEAMEIALATGYAEDIRPDEDYFAQKKGPHCGEAFPDIVTAWPDDWEEPDHPLKCKCAICGAEDVFDMNNCGIGIGITIRSSLVNRLFIGHTPPVSVNQLCLDCYKRSIPYLIRFREVLELRYYVNKLERAIRERRSKDNRPNQNNACQRSQGSIERRP